ncbi:MAG: hypothetical protein ACRCY8_14370 [Dermatophilaceae bacterium]
MVQNYHALDALSTAFLVAGLALFIASLFLFPPFGLAMTTAGPVLVATLSAELATAIAGSAALTATGIVLNEAANGAGPSPGPSGSSGSGGGGSSSNEVRSVHDVLGELPKGRSSTVRTVRSDAELGEVYRTLSQGGKPVDVPGYKGTWVERADGVRVGLREISKSGGRTIDIRYPDGTIWKVHVR